MTMSSRSNLVKLSDAERDAQRITVGLPGGYVKEESWAYWAHFAQHLNNLLASRLRGYPGPSTDPNGGDIGGTPAAVQLRRAA